MLHIRKVAAKIIGKNLYPSVELRNAPNSVTFVVPLLINL